MAKLSKPPRELAARLLDKLSFEERVIGIKEHPADGETRESIYSFEEAASFLGVEDNDLSGDGWVYSIEPNTLKKWVGETLGDKELALAIGEVTKEGDNRMRPYQRYLKRIELIRPVKELMQQRLKQCKEIIGEETET